MSRHTAIIGPTQSGKTTLGKAICAAAHAQGRSCLVLDPYHAPDWQCSFKTHDPATFIALAKKNRQCLLFVDEAGQLDFRDPQQEWLLTGSAQWGHVCFVMSQGGVHLSPLGREQFTRLCLFRATAERAIYWRDIFTDDRILAATNLKQFEFIYAEIFGECRKLKLELK